MASRVTDNEVKGIIEVDATLTDLSAFRTAANQIVVQHLEDLDAYDGTDGEAQLKEIERWLSAHMVAIRDMRVANEKAGSVGQAFQYKLGLNLQVTMYGQTACMLDSTGTLLSLSNSKGRKAATITSMDPVYDEDEV